MLQIIQSIDWKILHWIQQNMRCEVLDYIMPVITTLGKIGAIWLIFALCLTCSEKYRKYGVMLFVSLLAGVLIGNVCLKPLIARPRPCWLESVSLLVRRPGDYSFPSGHTLSSVSGATVLMFANPRLGKAAILLAVLIACSRLYLYVHFPSDVLAGAILGVMIAWGVRILMENGIAKRRKHQ